MATWLIIGTHARKGNSDETTYWKPKTPLDPSKIGDVKVIAAAYLTNVHISGCYHSEGFVRTEETVRVLLDRQSEPCKEISPYASFTDKEWYVTDPNCDMSASDHIKKWPDFNRKVGKVGGDYLRQKMANAHDGQCFIYMTHRGVAENIVDHLLKDALIGRTMKDFGQGDLFFIEYDVKNVIRSFRYCPASAAANVLKEREGQGA